MTMERTCIRCGKPLHGRVDKKFCSDDCRTDYHNQLRRERERDLRSINRILASNWKILTTFLRNGRSKVPVAELAGHNFNFEVYTNTRRRIPGRRTFWCYNCAYRVSRSGLVHIWEGTCQNIAYL
jgi:predicted nucleic acid-binding Zn ribbon protein